jgi:hypothetical protein|tara:strand:- start:1499 stop:1801 length:303 start_codon:yes stop_codon:yes gene_type:complete
VTRNELEHFLSHFSTQTFFVAARRFGTLTLRMRGQVFCRVGARTRATDLIGPDETVGELRARILGDAFAALPGADDVVRAPPRPALHRFARFARRDPRQP